MSAAALAAGAAAGPALARQQAEPHRHATYIDGMSFLPDDPNDVRLSGLDAFICDVSLGEMDVDASGLPFYHRKFELCDRSIDAASQRIKTDFPGLRVALTAADLNGPDKAAVFQFQGCEPIGTDLSRIGYFRDKSLRILQLTHNESNAFATSYVDERTGRGLSDLGREGVSEMNRVGLIPDVSHASEATALETIQRSSTPVILSHGACRSLLAHPRAATDAMIRAVADNGGVFGVFMMSFWLTEDHVPTTAHYVAHIRYAVNIGGIDAVGIANDYAMAGLKGATGKPFQNYSEDMAGYQRWWRGNNARGIPGFGPEPQHAVIPELNVIGRMALIHQALLDDGFAPADAEKIVGGNWLRFFKDNLK